MFLNGMISHFVLFMMLVLSISVAFIYFAIELEAGYRVGESASIRSGNVDCWLFGTITGISSVGLLIFVRPHSLSARSWEQFDNSLVWFFSPLSLYFIWQAVRYTLLTVKNAGQRQVSEALSAALKKNKMDYEKQSTSFLLPRA